MVNASNQGRAAAESDPFAFLKLIAEVSAVFVALTFVVGWSYLASYYKTFGLNPIELDIPVPVVATIALHMLYESVWPLPAVALTLAVLAAAAHRFTRWRGIQRGWVMLALVLFVFCSAVAALFRGRQMANLDMLEESPTLPLVAFSLKSPTARPGESDLPSCAEYTTFGRMDCKLLLHSKGVYYFFRPIATSMAEKTDKLDLFTIPDPEVIGLHVQRGVNLGRVHE